MGKACAGLEELAQRYARNLANGRFLWRNRAVAAQVDVRVRDKTGLDVRFDALNVPLRDFDNCTDDEKAVARRILAGLKGEGDAVLRVEADVDFGLRGALEVFPSQNYLENKATGFARPLYCVGEPPKNQDRHSVQELGQAALRDQKVGNALRTIDTWYPAFAERGLPLPWSPTAPAWTPRSFSGTKKNIQASGICSGWMRWTRIRPKACFWLACIIRGGVFSESA